MIGMSDDNVALARALHRRVIVVDTHCDTTQRLMNPDWDPAIRHADGHIDWPRLRDGGVAAVFFAVWAQATADSRGGMADAADAQIRRLQEVARRHTDAVVGAQTAQDIRQAKAQGRLAMLIGIEGGHLIDDSLDVLGRFRRRGATYLTLTHALHTNWADSAGVHEPLAPRHGGLTEFGRDVIRELNRLGMMVDVSHVSDDTFWQVLDVSETPVIATHSSCRAVAPHRRNVSDDMIRSLAARGGTVHINFASAFLDPDYPPPDPKLVHEWFSAGGAPRRRVTNHVTRFEWLVDHLDHALQLVGPDHVGIGSDFDGVPSLPEGMEDCSKLPYLTAALLQRGYSTADLEKVLGANVLRVMEACQSYAQRGGLREVAGTARTA